jgi:hypothetical protein
MSVGWPLRAGVTAPDIQDPAAFLTPIWQSTDGNAVTPTLKNNTLVRTPFSGAKHTPLAIVGKCRGRLYGLAAANKPMCSSSARDAMREYAKSGLDRDQYETRLAPDFFVHGMKP